MDGQENVYHQHQRPYGTGPGAVPFAPQPGSDWQNGAPPFEDLSDYSVDHLDALQDFGNFDAFSHWNAQFQPQVPIGGHQPWLPQQAASSSASQYSMPPSLAQSGHTGSLSGTQPSTQTPSSTGTGQGQVPVALMQQCQPAAIDNVHAWLGNHSERLKHHVRIWMSGIEARGQDLASEMEGFAPMCGMNHYDLYVLVTRLKWEDANAMNDDAVWSPRATSVEVDQTGDISMRRQQAADRYVINQRLHDGADNHNVRTRQGMFRCIVTGCSFAHNLKYEWKRHVSKHWPESIYVCELCLSETAPTASQGKVSVFHRKDKLGDHLSKIHKAADGDLVIKATEQLPILRSDNFPSHCTYEDRLSGAKCSTGFKSMGDCFKHWAAHFKTEANMVASKMVRSGPLESKASRPAKKQKRER